MNATQIILAKKLFNNTTRRQEFETKIQLSDSKFEFAGEWLIGVGWVIDTLS